MTQSVAQHSSRSRSNANGVEAAAMEAVSVDLDRMKVTELAEELEARGAPRTGRKAALQRRLRAVIIAAQREADGEEEEFGDGGGEEGEEGSGGGPRAKG